MIKVALFLCILLSKSFVAFSQNNLPVVIYGQANQVKLKIPEQRLSNIAKCNIDVMIPGKNVYGQEVESPSFEFLVDITPQELGIIAIKWEGKTKFRGLATVMACPGDGAFNINVVSNSQQIRELWSKFFKQASAETGECVKVGLNYFNIKYDSLDPLTQLISPEDFKIKPIYEKCDNFFKLPQPKNSISCVIPVLNNLRTICDGSYAERLNDGRLRVISLNDALKLHFEGKTWAISISENVGVKEIRLRADENIKAREIAIREQELRLKEEELKRREEEASRLRNEAERIRAQSDVKKPASPAVNKISPSSSSPNAPGF